MTALDPMSDFSEQGSSEIVCPGKAAARRLRQFERAWTSSSITSSTGRRHPIVKLTIDDLHIARILGHGSFSTVRQVYIRNTTTGHFDSERAFAVKQLKAHVIADEYALKVAASDLALETKILSSLEHANIIRLHGIKDGDMIESLKEGNFFIITDLLVETLKVRLSRWAKKSLFRRRSGITTIKRLKEVAMGIANGMAYLHSKRIMYR
jgi:serine/threonine protein kinase